MTPRPIARTRRAAAGLALGIVGLLGLAGCDPRALAYFLQPYEPTIGPMGGPVLKGKRVVVLTHAVSAAQSDAPGVDVDLGRKFAAILKEKVKGIDLVDSAKVRAWAEANPNWSDPAEAAKAFEADLAIFLEVDEFEIQNANSPGLFQGKSSVHVQVAEWGPPKDPKGKPMKDMPKVASPGFDDVCTTEFPNRGPQPMETGVTRPAFRKKFLDLVATELSWRFIDHAPGDNIQDVSFGPK